MFIENESPLPVDSTHKLYCSEVHFLNPPLCVVFNGQDNGQDNGRRGKTDQDGQDGHEEIFQIRLENFRKTAKMHRFMTLFGHSKFTVTISFCIKEELRLHIFQLRLINFTELVQDN